MATLSQNEITGLLLEWEAGNKEAFDKLISLVYRELRRMARQYMRRERAGATLQTTALINELYIRLIDYTQMRWQDRAHFFAVAAQAMRRILVERARARQSDKRGAGTQMVSLDEAANLAVERTADLVALDDALTSLAAVAPRKVQIVELRYFGGLSIEEAAEVLGVSSPTVQREWRAAKAWLYRAISERISDEPPTL
ncbi:MAG TPA: sigma-70 family RNA polymerase sigma factor [Blastocatellia bacterium]|nr:sigma-70 family RNA polymerase sigma factor [Blastocatellia bacterium]